MKTFKKIHMGLGFMAAIFAAVVLFSGHSSAATSVPNFKLRFADSKGDSITGTYNNQPFKFTDAGLGTANSRTYVVTSNSPICSGSEILLSVTDPDFATNGASANPHNFRYGKGCQSLPDTTTLPIAPVGGGAAPKTNIDWTTAKGTLINDGDNEAEIDIVFADGSKLTVTDSDISDKTINFKPESGGKLDGVNVTGWCSDTVFGGDGTRGITMSSFTDKTASVNVCYYTPGQVIETGQSFQIDISKFQAPTSNTADKEGSCEANYTGAAHEFNWLFCSLLRGVDSIFNTLYAQTEGQLDICTGTSSTTGDTCGGNLLSDQVEKSWAIFRDLASALLVIAMLIMVFSEAISAGPFDAYTVRKMLPRIAAAAILIQISWPLLKFFIDISNDLGRGIQELMLVPFGGAGRLAFDNLVGRAGSLQPGFLTVGLFSSIVIVGLFSGLTIFGWLLIGLTAAASVIVGLFVLLIRQMLIIMAVILSPIAFIAYILPGTERYWKMWKDNFIKLLAMFPLIMAMIASGQIFAYIGTTTSSNGLFKLIIVLIGFLAPLWFLPKTFKWGGQLFSAAASGIYDGTKKYRGYTQKYALDRAKENRQQRATLRAARLADDPNNRRFRDRLMAGEFNFARSRGRGGQLGSREMQFAKTLHEGEKATRESVPAQLLRSGYDSWRHGPALDERGERILEGQPGYEINKLDALQAWLEGRTYAGITPDAALRGHAFDTLTQLGDPDRIRMARQNAEIPEEIWSKAVARNFSQLNQIARYLTLSPDLSNLAPRQFTTQDDDTAQELVRQLEGHYIYNRETGGRTEQTLDQHRQALQRAADLAADARNPLIWSDLGQAKRRAIEQIETMAAAEGVRGVTSGGGRRAPDAPAPPPMPPPPPEGPGPEVEEGEIRIDRDSGE